MTRLSFKTNRGYVVLTTVIFFVAFSAILIIGMASPIVRQLAIARDTIYSKSSYYTAEAGGEEAFYRLKNGLPITFPLNLFLNDASAAINSTLTSPNEREIVSTGNRQQYIRTVRRDLAMTNGFSFHFGVQAGRGGLLMENDSKVLGNVYSNGLVTGTGSGGNVITGDVVSATTTGRVTGIIATSSIYAHVINSSKACGDAYYQTIDASSLNFLNNPTSTYCGSNLTPGTAHPGSLDQPEVPFPITDELIETWKTEAEAGGVIDSPCPYIINNSTTLSSKKIDCDVIVSGNSTELTLTGNVWIKGDLEMRQGASVRISPTLGNKSVAIIADDPDNRASKGVIAIQNNTEFFGSGGADSYIMLISQNNASESGSGAVAINVVNGAVGNLLVFAPHGEILVQNNVYLRETTAYKLHLINNAVVDYQIGLAQPLFVTGPGGTWKIKHWREI